MEPNGEMRVLQIASGDLWAGAEVQLYNLATSLMRYQGVRVHVALMNPGELDERLRAAGVETTVLDESRQSNVQLIAGLMRLMRSFRPHVVHSHRQKENVLGALANRLSVAAPMVRTVHGPREHFFRPWQAVKHLQRFSDIVIGRWLQDRIVGVSHEIPRRFLPTLFPRHKVRVVENGIDIEGVQAVARQPVEYPDAGGRVKVAFAARLVSWKRPDLFLDSAAELLAREPERYVFYVYGKGPLRGPLEQQAHRLGIADNIHFMGFQPHVQALLARMDMLVITSAQEGLPMLMLEALSLKLPVIAAPVGGIPDVLGDSEYGVLVHEQQAQRYADAVQTLSSDAAATAARSERALEMMHQRYSHLANASGYLAIYQELIGESVPRPVASEGRA